MFLSPVERALIRRAEAAGERPPVEFVPTSFSEAPRLLTERVQIDTFVVTVSPMDRHGRCSDAIHPAMPLSQCLLWVESGHFTTHLEVPVYAL